MNCKNCGRSVAENFCSYCGQSSKVGKITFSNFLSDISSSIFQIDRGLFYSIKELFVRPGHSIREYLDGKRKNHFKPVAFLFTLSTIFFLISQFLESSTFLNYAIEGFSNVESTSGSHSEELEILNWFAKNYAYTMLMLLPLFTLSCFLAFLGSGVNYLEHFILNAYITGQKAILYALSAMMSLIISNEDLLTTTTLIISIGYTFFVFRQFFSDKSGFNIIVRTLLTYVLFYILLSVAIFTILLLLG
ncbi:MAG: DUF3667 domain-containing protein [Balneolaceae bacterium]